MHNIFVGKDSSFFALVKRAESRAIDMIMNNNSGGEKGRFDGHHDDNLRFSPENVNS